MKEQIIIREYKETDHKFLENMVREAWKYDRFCSEKISAKMAEVYLNSCLTNQTFIAVAEIDGIPAGVIMAKDNRAHKCPLSLRLKWLKSVAALFISGEGRKISKIFMCVQDIDKELLSACEKKYEGEIALFVIDKRYRGRGLGRQLFQKAVAYMKEQGILEFYLFTDTSCNYPFYEHVGMTRRCQKKQEIDVNGEKGDMTFFIYDSRC